MEKKELYVIIVGNLKGGVGKTTVTNYLADYLYRNLDMRVLVVDADDDQTSLTTLRKAEEFAYVNEYGDEAWEELEKYDLIPMASASVKDHFHVIYENYDIVLFDVPGNMAQEGVKDIYHLADAIIIPYKTGDNDILSTNNYIEFLREHVVPVRRKNNLDTEILYFLNMVSNNTGRSKTLLNDPDGLDLGDSIKKMKNFVGHAPAAFGENVSTVEMAFGDKYEKYVVPLCEEIIETLKLR